MSGPSDTSSPESAAEPIFTGISSSDRDFQLAYGQAATTLPVFVRLIEGEDGDSLCSAKLRFRDPDESERLGEDRFVFIWLTGVRYHADDRLFSGTFFEVPAAFQKWHKVGDQLAFDSEDIFDWMVLCKGELQGGFTLRVSRSRLPEEQREDYDRYVGISTYAALP